jgi:hypothetical protein
VSECSSTAIHAEEQAMRRRFGSKDDRIAFRTSSAGPSDHASLT